MLENGQLFCNGTQLVYSKSSQYHLFFLYLTCVTPCLFQEMLSSRAALPIAGLKVDILQMLKENDVLVVCGETGSGKTTQVSYSLLQYIHSNLLGNGHIMCSLTHLYTGPTIYIG